MACENPLPATEMHCWAIERTRELLSNPFLQFIVKLFYKVDFKNSDTKAEYLEYCKGTCDGSHCKKMNLFDENFAAKAMDTEGYFAEKEKNSTPGSCPWFKTLEERE